MLQRAPERLGVCDVKFWPMILAALLSVAVSACSEVVPTERRWGRNQTDQTEHASQAFTSEQVILKLAQEYDATVTWEITWEPEIRFREENGEKFFLPMWKAEATYPVGTRVIIYFDEATGERLGVYEAPAGTLRSDGE
jgi:hypothetical protein